MNGNETIRAMKPVFIFALIGIVFMFTAPFVLQLFTIINLTTAIALGPRAQSCAGVGLWRHLVFWTGRVFWTGGLCLHHRRD